MREEAFPEVQRDPLDRGEFGRVRRQEQRREVGRDGELPGDVPAGPVNQDHGVGAGADRLGEFASITCMAAAATVGGTRATPASRAGQTAPNR